MIRDPIVQALVSRAEVAREKGKPVRLTRDEYALLAIAQAHHSGYQPTTRALLFQLPNLRGVPIRFAD